MTKAFDDVGGLLDNVKNILDGVRGCFEAYQSQLKADALLKIASAIAILAGSILIIATIDSNKLTASLGAISVLFAELMIAMGAFTKTSGQIKGVIKGTTAMLGLSTSMLILASALKMIATFDPKQMATGLIGIAGLMTAMVVAVSALGSGGTKLSRAQLRW